MKTKPPFFKFHIHTKNLSNSETVYFVKSNEGAICGVYFSPTAAKAAIPALVRRWIWDWKLANWETLKKEL
jgi:hypothetical protein